MQVVCDKGFWSLCSVALVMIIGDLLGVSVSELLAVTAAPAAGDIPVPLDAYGDSGEVSLLKILTGRILFSSFNLVATIIFFLAILHTFIAPFFLSISKKMQKKFRSSHPQAQGNRVSVAAEIMHFVGEVEVVFGLWVVVLLGAFCVYFGLDDGSQKAIHYMTYAVNYTEPVFIVVIMTLAATKPVCDFTRMVLGSVVKLGGSTPLAWWAVILTLAPILGSFITEPAAMTIAAMLLGQQFYEHKPSQKLQYATLGLLFVNISVGGTFTNFAAPPVLMVAHKWDWSSLFMLEHFAWKAALGIVISNIFYFLIFYKELTGLGKKKTKKQQKDTYSPWWVIVVHMIFMAWTVMMAHYVVFFVGGFLFFLGFYRATRHYQEKLALTQSLLVGFFLAGLVIHGGLQGWWIQPVLSSLNETSLMFTSMFLTAFNDNAAITYLASLIPNLSDGLKYAVMSGALIGGGLTVIANAPNPAGQAILSPYFDMERVHPLLLILGALLPTVVMTVIFLYL